jgi:DNA invertase Pin-like site-specific DNA recombinase
MSQDLIALINNIINYLRRSRQDIEREKRTGEDTLATQKKIMAKVLDDLRIPYTQVEEIGSGDKIDTRPVFQQVLTDIENGKYNAIAVKEIPRLGRGTYSDMGKIYDLLVSKRIFIITPYKIYDPQNPADARQIRFELFFAREEFEMIKERLVSAKYNLAHEGKWICGAAPFGYKLNNNTMRLEPFEEEAKIVQLIFTFYVYGIETSDDVNKEVSFRAIATHLTRLGVPTPRNAKSWSYLSVKRIIENEVYAGTLKYRTRKRVGNKYFERPSEEWIIVKNAHLPIIDPETWELAQKKLQGRNKIPNTKLDFSPCELAGLVVCNQCGKRMVRQYSVQKYKKKTSNEVSVYHKEFLWCTTPGCTFVKYRQVEESLIEYLKHLSQLDVQRLKEVFIDLYNSQKEIATTIDSADLATKKIEELKRRLRFVCEKYESGIYDDAMFLERKQEIQKEIDLLQKITEKESTSNSNNDKEFKDFITFKNNISSILSAYTTCKNKTLKNELLRRLIDVVILNKTGKGTFDLIVQPKIFGTMS